LISYFIFVLFNFLNFLIYKNASFDFDSASHIYAGKNNRRFSHSYRFGVKLPIIKLYEIFYNKLNFENNFYRFVNFLLINTSVLIIYFSPKYIDTSNTSIFLFLLIINSPWLNPSTSSSEMYESVILILLISLPYLLQNNLLILSILSFGVFILIFFKYINLIYLFPITFYYLELGYNLYILFFVFAILILFSFSTLKKSKKYIRSRRGFFNIKTLKFILSNKIFIITYSSLIIFVFFNADIVGQLFIGTSLLITFLQKQFFSYFLINTSTLLIFFNSQNSTYVESDKLFLTFCLSVITFLSIINYYDFFKTKDFFVLVRSVQREDVSGDKKILNEQVKYINKLISNNEKCFFLGTDTPLLLELSSINLVNNYFNQNHLYYWSGVDDPVYEILSEIKTNSPVFILVSREMDFFSLDEIEKLEYVLLKDVSHLKIYKKITV